MLDKKHYANGQAVYELAGNKLTYYFKNGTIKAEGIFENGLMEGEWKFYRETGQLWQIGHFIHGGKDGAWVRFGRGGQLEYEESFREGKRMKK